MEIKKATKKFLVKLDIQVQSEKMLQIIGEWEFIKSKKVWKMMPLSQSSHGILSSRAGRVEPGPDLALVMSRAGQVK